MRALYSNDVGKQRAKFFSELSAAGYGAVLDVNDGIYGGFKASSPVIVFDQKSIRQGDVSLTTQASKRLSTAITIAQRTLHL